LWLNFCSISTPKFTRIAISLVQLSKTKRKLNNFARRTTHFTSHNKTILTKFSYSPKLLLYKTILKPICTYGIELWGRSKSYNTKLLQAFQSKTLRLIINAPRYVNNQTLHTDLSIPYIDEVISTAARNSTDRNSNPHNPLIANLYHRPLGNRRLRRNWPEDLIE
jgi:hypothetical protein